MSNYLLIVGAVLFPALVFTILYLINLNNNLKQEIKKIKQTPQPSEELTDFLRDIQVNGFSFVRVAPDSVLLRSPQR
jgi:hypothetical protein